MKNVPLEPIVWVGFVCLLAACCTLPGWGEGNPSGSQASTTNSATSVASRGPTAQAAGTPSAADIAAAKASGKVWVNLKTGIYHRGGRWYGKTKDGKFMTADEAKKAGYKAAKRD